MAKTLTMYQWLLEHTGKKTANVLIFIWYLLLVGLVLYTIDLQPGRFRYLRW